MHIFTHALAPYSLLYHSTISQVSRSHINARRVIPFHLIPTFLHTPYCSHCLEGIEPFILVNSLPGQVGAMSSHLINPPSGLLEVTSSISSPVPTSALPCVT